MDYKSFNRTSAFLQIDFYDGVRILDKLGEIIFYYKENYSDIIIHSDKDGMTLKNINEKINEIKINDKKIWFNFKIDKIEDIYELVPGHIKLLEEKCNIKIPSRIGLRCNYLMPTKNRKIIDSINSQITFLKNTNLDVLVMKRSDENSGIENRLILQLLVSIDDINDYAIGLDIDTSVTKKMDSTNIGEYIQSIINSKEAFLKEAAGGLK